ncbi:complement C1q-like protein 2 [Saccostrea echinata]|uniref:complement C1q-like protein 2 n=1 Tax=Saccostrea echinata TaxID=191078 RepID=UPI002A812127|nr:complement C1q-like protein 2 [Saccostrea echinata]
MKLNTTVFFLCVLHCMCALSTTDKMKQNDEIADIKNRLGHLEQVIGQLVTGNSSLDVLKFLASTGRNEHVSFSAYKNQTQSGLNQRHIIKFEKTILNLGNHYHPEDGIFIAPVSGVYLFHWTMINYGDYAHTNILVGGKVMSTTTTSVVSGHYNSGSALVIVHVQKGEHVWIQICCGSGHEVYGTTLGLDNNFQSTFSGTLLFPVSEN